MRKNIASQNVAAQVNSATDGTPLTTGVSVFVTLDGGTQGAGGGTTAHKGNGHWNYAPTQAETNGNHVAFTFTHASGVNQTVNVYTVSFDPHDTADLGLTNLDAAISTRLAPTVAGRTLDVTATGEAGLDLDNTAGTLAKGTELTGFNDLDAAGVAAAVWNEDATGHQTQGSFGQVIGDSGADTDSIWSLANTNLDAAISSRASAAALATVQADTDDIQSRLPAALVSGRMDASVGAMAADTVTASALAADAGTEIADALLKRDMSAVTGESARSLLNAIRKLMNKWSISGSTLTVFKEDDATTAYTQAVTATAGADPITALDTT